MDTHTPQAAEAYEAPAIEELAVDEGPASIQAGARQQQTIIG